MHFVHILQSWKKKKKITTFNQFLFLASTLHVYSHTTVSIHAPTYAQISPHIILYHPKTSFSHILYNNSTSLLPTVSLLTHSLLRLKSRQHSPASTDSKLHYFFPIFLLYKYSLITPKNQSLQWTDFWKCWTAVMLHSNKHHHACLTETCGATV